MTLFKFWVKIRFWETGTSVHLVWKYHSHWYPQSRHWDNMSHSTGNEHLAKYRIWYMKNKVIFFLKFLDISPFGGGGGGALIHLFWTSGDVSSGFQSKSRQPYLHLAEAYTFHVPWDSPLVLHLPTYRTTGELSTDWAMLARRKIETSYIPTTPALFTRISSRCSFWIMSAVKSLTDFKEHKSSFLTTTFWFLVSRLMWRAASSPFSVLRHARITRAFLTAKSYAVWYPIPTMQSSFLSG